MATRMDGGRAKTMAAITNPQFRLPGTKTSFAPVGTGTVLKPQGAGTVLKPTAAPAATSSRSFSGGGGGGGSYGGGGGGGGMVAPMAAPAAPPMSEQDYLNSDDVYLAALSRYNKNFDDLSADITRRQNDYNVTHENSLDDLGYLAGSNGGPAGWDFQNQQTAAGRGFQQLIQDFAARGLLHSGDYLGAQNDFTATLGKQLDAMNLAKQQFGEGLNQERTTGQTSRDAGIGQARAEALARMQQLYGGI